MAAAERAIRCQGQPAPGTYPRITTWMPRLGLNNTGVQGTQHSESRDSLGPQREPPRHGASRIPAPWCPVLAWKLLVADADAWPARGSAGTGTFRYTLDTHNGHSHGRVLRQAANTPLWPVQAGPRMHGTGLARAAASPRTHLSPATSRDVLGWSRATPGAPRCWSSWRTFHRTGSPGPCIRRLCTTRIGLEPGGWRHRDAL